MTDILSIEQRSRLMSKVKSTDTKPERLVRSILHRMGFRFRIHITSLPGKPDIVLSKYRTVIFVNGCFWHRHKDCKYAYTPKSRTDFWIVKFDANIELHNKVTTNLSQLGWNVITVWECEIRDPFSLSERLTKLIKT